MKIANKISVGKLEWKITLATPGCKWDNIKMGLK
jgi:hypothetical protein